MTGMFGRDPSGFTLIELVLVLFLVGVLSVAAIPAFQDIGIAKTEASARKLVSDLSYARQLARTRNQTHGVLFDPAAETYTVYLYDPVAGTETPVTDPVTGASMMVDFTTYPSLSGTDIQSATFGATHDVRFSSQGVPQDGGGTALAVAGSVVLESAGTTRTIFVQPNTGEVSHQ